MKYIGLLFLLLCSESFAASPQYGNFPNWSFRSNQFNINVPLGPVSLIKPDGTMTNLPGSTAAAAGQSATNAQSLSKAGDLVLITATATVPARLGKDGVGWWFSPGVKIQNDNTSIFDDSTGAANLHIDGMADFVSTGEIDTFVFNNANTVVHLNCNSISNLFGDSDANGFHLTAGTSYINIASALDALNADGFLIEGGTNYITCPLIRGGQSPIQTLNGEVHIKSQFMVADGYGLDNEGGTLYVDTDVLTGGIQSILQISGHSFCDCHLNARVMNGDITVNGGRLYINGPTINGTITVSTNTLTLANCNVVSSGPFSITATTPQTVCIVGSVNLNKPVNTNVTLVGTNYTVGLNNGGFRVPYFRRGQTNLGSGSASISISFAPVPGTNYTPHASFMGGSIAVNTFTYSALTTNSFTVNLTSGIIGGEPITWDLDGLEPP